MGAERGEKRYNDVKKGLLVVCSVFVFWQVGRDNWGKRKLTQIKFLTHKLNLTAL